MSLKIVWIKMTFLPSRVPITMKIACLFVKDSLPTLIDWLTTLQWAHLCKITSLSLTIKKSTINDLKAMGEKQLETSASDPLVVSKVPISQKITLNKIEIWNHTDTGQSKCKVELSLFKSAVKKINSACKHRKTM